MVEAQLLHERQTDSPSPGAHDAAAAEGGEFHGAAESCGYGKHPAHTHTQTGAPTGTHTRRRTNTNTGTPQTQPRQDNVACPQPEEAQGTAPWWLPQTGVQGWFCENYRPDLILSILDGGCKELADATNNRVVQKGRTAVRQGLRASCTPAPIGGCEYIDTEGQRGKKERATKAQQGAAKGRGKLTMLAKGTGLDGGVGVARARPHVRGFLSKVALSNAHGAAGVTC